MRYYVFVRRILWTSVSRSGFEIAHRDYSEKSIVANLSRPQRSSREILELCEFIRNHETGDNHLFDGLELSGTFSHGKPLWFEFCNRISLYNFLDQFEDKFDSNDVMFVYDRRSEETHWVSQHKKEWRVTNKENIRGSEASMVILFHLDSFYFEYLTRAKHQLIFITIQKYLRFHKNEFTKTLNRILLGRHNDKNCKFSNCEYRTDRRKIQNLLQKIHIDENGTSYEVKFKEPRDDLPSSDEEYTCENYYDYMYKDAIEEREERERLEKLEKQMQD